jgi:hypothetical protein
MGKGVFGKKNKKKNIDKPRAQREHKRTDKHAQNEKQYQQQMEKKTIGHFITLKI